MTSFSRLAAVLLLVSIGVASAFDDDSLPLLSSSSTSSDTAPEHDIIPITETHLPETIQSLIAVNTFIRSVNLDVERQKSKIVAAIKDLAQDASISDMDQIVINHVVQAWKPELTFQELQVLISQALNDMLKMVEAGGKPYPNHDEIRDTILSMIEMGQQHSPTNSYHVTSLQFIAEFLHMAVNINDPDLSAESFIFIPFLLSHFSDDVFPLGKHYGNESFILNLLHLYRQSSQDAADRTEWRRFLISGNSLYERLRTIRILTKAKGFKEIAMQMLGLSRGPYPLSDEADQFIRMLPGPARRQVWLELYHHERGTHGMRALHDSVQNDVAWKLVMGQYSRFHSQASPRLVSAIYQSPNLLHFLNCFRSLEDATQGPANHSQPSF